MDNSIAARIAAAEAREPERIAPEEAAELAGELANDDGYRIEINKQIAKTSKAHQRAVSKYVKNNYDRMDLTLPKGRKAAIKAIAERNGESANSFVNQAIAEKIRREERRIN